MSDIDERPSKIRKVGSTDNASASGDVIPLNSPSNDITMELETPTTTQDTPTNINSNTTESSTAIDANQPNPLSKSQIKKRRKQEEWEASKSKRAEFRRIKRKEKQARKAAAHASGLLPPPPPPSSRRPIQVPVAFLIDCDFESYMMEKEIISLTAQVTRCYSDNRTAVYRGHMGIAGWGGKMKERFEGVLAGNFNSWKGVKFMEEGWLEAAGVMGGIMKGPEGGKLLGALATKNGLEEYKKPVKGSKNLEGSKGESRESTQPEIEEDLEPSEWTAATSVAPETTSIPAVSETSQVPEPSAPSSTTTPTHPNPSIIYLTSDSPNTLTTLTPNTTYIIGGIVDKNRHKGLCYKRACDAGVATAKLPIGEYMTMQSRTVLTVNHVMEIMIRWLETGDWGEAFLKVIPKRKEAKLRTKGRDREEGEDGHDEEGHDEHDEHGENEEEKSGNGSEDSDEGGVSLEAEHTGGEKVTKQSSENDTTIADAK